MSMRIWAAVGLISGLLGAGTACATLERRQSSEVSAGRPFSLLVYNVENLFDGDGVSTYDEYQPNLYTPGHLRRKLDNIARLVAQIDAGRGPDIILFQEIEVDRSPDRDPSAERLLLETFEREGLRGYTAVAGGDSPFSAHEDGNPRSIQVVTFTRFPVESVRRHPLLNARNILEVKLDVHGSPFYVFNNHWKSGASDPEMEKIRVENARVLRKRLDEILASDPQADIVIGGDLNSQYNQKPRYGRMMPVTALNDVLGSQGDELAIRGSGASLYNLWFELPPERRGSDTWRGEWGTLMHLLITRGLQDQTGIQYVDNSFGVLKTAGMNATAEGLPVRWTNEQGGGGYSDHFPLYARFVRVGQDRPDAWVELIQPSRTPEGPATAVKSPERAPVFDLKTALPLSELPATVSLRDGSYNGRLARVEGVVEPGQRISIRTRGESWEVWIPDAPLREKTRARWKEGDRVAFYGVIGQFRGKWQFTVQQAGWLDPR